LFTFLRQRWQLLFDAQFEVLLYDLTSTYFECDVPETGQRKFGYSRDKRSDCVQVVIALIVLLPETWAAVRAAAGNRLQTSLNLALGSALASIGLTIPVVVVLSIALDRPLLLGLPPKEIALLALTLLVATLTLSAGRTTVLQGAVHLVLFCTFLFLAAVP
jgi:Ca2+/H+ antiporter